MDPRLSSSRLPAMGGRGEGWFAIQVALLVLAGAAGILGPVWEGPVRVVTTIVGVTAIAAGGLVAFLAARSLRSALTPLPRPREDAALVDDGVYGVIRHPIYAGVIVGAIGWGLLTASAAALVVATLLTVFLDLKARREEAWLLEQYPGYDAYRRRTRRFLPGVY